ncbi:MAG: hypothetical protein KIT54_07675 [Phycisphaeraceae bacterium]|nr:hypothetical protein [Phycisphaeraceae bacterium]
MTIGSIRRQESNHRPALTPALALVLAGLLAFLWPQPAALAQPCEPQWAEGVFGVSGISGTVYALVVFDDGTGEALYAGGRFTTAGGLPVNNIARWDGSAWTPLGTGIEAPRNSSVRTLAIFDDGTGEALYAGGEFTTAGGVPASNIARWDGSAWTPLGDGVNDRVHVLTVFDDGSGEALYAGGTFRNASGTPANRVARWDGSAWSPLGMGVDSTIGSVNALAVWDDGTGPALYAGGLFDSITGVIGARSIARWDGSAWTRVRLGVDGTIYALAVYDDGTGEALYAGGQFITAGVETANRIARWDGTQWTTLGSGMTGNSVDSLLVYDDGAGGALYAGGDFRAAGGVSANRIARWDGSAWSPMGMGTNGTVHALAAFDDGTGDALYAGGAFRTTGGESINRIARWDGSAWLPLGPGMNNAALASTVFDDGTGPALIVGGAFNRAGDVRANRVSRWDGSAWSPMGAGFDNSVFALTAYDDGSGEALYAGGMFTSSGGVPANRVARWDGSAWVPLGEGMNERVLALTVFDDGTGPALYAGGFFTTAGGVPANGIARWDSSAWAPLGEGVGGDAPVVSALAVYDDGTGESLYVGGWFTLAGGASAYRVARWDGSAWTPLGGGVKYGSISRVMALTAFDDGSGEALYAGGNFTTADGEPANHIARWDGSTWTPLGSGMNTTVESLAVFDDGSGDALYAGGDFTTAGSVEANRIARWDGAAWSALGRGMNLGVNALTVFDDGSGPALYAGGSFTTAGGVASGFMAKWGCVAEPCRADLDGDGELTIFDFLLFQNLFAAGDLRADFDGDGELTLFDFLAFQNEFAAGCE